MRKRPDYKRALEKLMKILGDVDERQDEKRNGMKEKIEIEDVTEASLGTSYQFTDYDLTIYNEIEKDKDDER